MECVCLFKNHYKEKYSDIFVYFDDLQREEISK